MNNYQGVTLELQQLIDSLEEKTYENFKSELLNKTTNVYIKEQKDSKLVMISNTFTTKTNNISNLERECRSVIIDRDELKVICYSYDDIYYNQDAKDYLIKNNNSEIKIQECFEGTLMSLYFYNDKWNLGTRRCIDANKSIWNSNKTYYNLFLECINTSFDEFTSYLNEEYNYFFVIVHHQNKHIVDYTDYFKDDEYKKLLHVLTRRRSNHEEIIDNQWKKNPIFIEAKEYEAESNTDDKELQISKIADLTDFSKLDKLNTKNKLDLPVKSEGLIVKLKHLDTNKVTLLKFQTNSYQFMGMLKPNTNNIYMSFIELYQNDMLKRHLEYFPGNSKFDNDNKTEVYDTVGIIDATFKVLTSELFELFRALYNLKDCSHKNEDLYSKLPTEYTIALYKIRGIYYKKKEKYIKSKQSEDGNESSSSTTNTGLRIFDIYNMLKYTYDTKELLKLLRARKVLFYNCGQDKSNVNNKKILSLSYRCDKVSIKMITIMLNKMFPKDNNIDIEGGKNTEVENEL